MRTSGSRPLPARGPPPSGSMRRPPAVPPLPFQRPRFLRNQAARSRWRRVRLRGSASHPHGGLEAAETVRTLWTPVRSRAGNASVPGERRPGRRVRMEEGMAWLRAGVGRASFTAGSRGRRRGYTELGLEGAVLTASTSAEFGGRPRVRPPHLRNSTCKLGRKIVEIWLLEGPNPSLYGTRKPRIPFPVQS